MNSAPPTPISPLSTPRWTSARTGSSSSVPSIAPRVSSTPCHNGEIQAIGWMDDGRLSSGKKVPLNRNSGVMTQRNIALKAFGLRRVAMNAPIPPANARPVRTPAGIASKASGDETAPKNVLTSRNTLETRVRRNAIQSMVPTATARGPIGVAYMAWKIRRQTRPIMTGNVDSKIATCIADPASSPGARKWRYGTPPKASGLWAFT